MSGLSTYYYIAAILFLADAICDIIFNAQFSVCPFSSSASGIFMILAIINIILIFFLLQLGFLVNYFDGLDPDELLNLGWIKKLLGILVKVYPNLIKIVHYVKVLLVLIAGYFAFFNNVLTIAYLDDINFNLTTISDKHCLDVNSTLVTKTMDNYTSQVLIFEIVELSSLFIALCILGTIKNLLEVDGYFYEPDNREHGGCRKFICKRLGP